MKKIINIILVLFLCLTFIGFVNDSVVAAKNYELKLGHVCQVDHPYNLAAQSFKEKVEERTDGKVKINIYPARQLGGDRDMLEMIQMGTLDMGFISAAVFSNFTPHLNGLQLPWLLEDYDTLTEVITSDITYELLDSLEEIDLKGIAIYDAGFRNVMTIETPVQEPKDFEGLKIRSVEAPHLMDFMSAVGANPTPMPYGEIYSALQTGVIDGLEMDLSAMVLERHYEVAKHVTMTHHFSFPTVNIMNIDLWNQLPEEYQEIIQKAANEVILENHNLLRELDKKYRAELEENNVKFHEMQNREKWMEMVQPVYEKYMDKDPLTEKFVKRVREIKESMEN